MYRSYTVLSKILRCFQQECQKTACYKLIWQQVNVIEKQILFIRLYGHEKLSLHREKLSQKFFMFKDLFGKYWPWHKWNVGCHWQHLTTSWQHFLWKKINANICKFNIIMLSLVIHGGMNLDKMTEIVWNASFPAMLASFVVRYPFTWVQL